ncbi:hypothetical protein KR222_006419, partial [Zaprionus bogoriensis]
MLLLLVCLPALLRAHHLPGRIIGGSDASIEEIPSQISLQRNGQHIFGGSIYSEEIVITAAHCVENAPVEQLQIRAGSSLHNRDGIVLDVDHVVEHPSYAITQNNDIAIVHLAKCLAFGPKVMPIALALRRPKSGTIATVSGWGITNYIKQTSKEILQKAELRIVNPIICKLLFKRHFSHNMLCVHYIGRSACSGDSGGPLVVNGELVGIVSFGLSICLGHNVFTDVAALCDWIITVAEEISDEKDKTTEVP